MKNSLSYSVVLGVELSTITGRASRDGVQLSGIAGRASRDTGSPAAGNTVAGRASRDTASPAVGCSCSGIEGYWESSCQV